MFILDLYGKSGDRFIIFYEYINFCEHSFLREKWFKVTPLIIN